MFLRTTLYIVFSTLLFSHISFSEEYIVSQKGKAFTESHLVIKKGDSVNFLNEDPFFHNVFSLSDTKFFDLGSYPQNQSKSVIFEEAGTIEVECAIHPEMKMTIEVK